MARSSHEQSPSSKVTNEEQEEKMAKVYKVWIQIEEIDEENDIYEDATVPHSAGEFPTLKEAETHFHALLEIR